MKTILVGLLIGLTLSCNCGPTPEALDAPKPGRPEVIGGGVVRSVDWYHRSFLYEADAGYVKAFGPICSAAQNFPVWQGMVVLEMHYHWDQMGNFNQDTPENYGCFKIDYVGTR